MVPIVSFIGRQNSGKTTVASKVVSRLREKGYRVGAIKSTHHEQVIIDRPGSDTDTYRKSGAHTVTLLAPDQMFTLSDNPLVKLRDLVNLKYNDMDIVIAEGFKEERHVVKIEVSRDSAPTLRNEVGGVAAFVSNEAVEGEQVFAPDQIEELTDFIIHTFIDASCQTEAVLFVNGNNVPLKGFVQDALAGTVGGFVRTLKKTDGIKEITLIIRFERLSENE